jgi:hypothetical protein
MASLAEQCSHPVTLSRSTINTATGAVSAPEMINKACGSRLADRCPSCSEVYRRDLVVLIGEGLRKHLDRGEVVTFLTFTAPGAEVFGQTHTRPTKRRKDGTPYTYPCPCGRLHAEEYASLGTPLDPSTYDYDAAADWNANASRLLAVTMQRLSRLTYPRASTAEEPQRQLERVRVVEFQRRGLVHFHLLVRGDVRQEHFDAVVRGSGTPGQRGHIKPSTSHGIVWGTQCDRRRIVKGGKHSVGYYLLKVVGYATKSAGSGVSGTSRHVGNMTKAGARSCTCEHALTCHDGPDALKVRTPTAYGAPGVLTVTSPGKREHQQCVRHRLARRGWGFRGHVFASSRRWGVTLREIRERRSLHVGGSSLPTVRQFELAREKDPSLATPHHLAVWQVIPTEPLRA